MNSVGTHFNIVRGFEDRNVLDKLTFKLNLFSLALSLQQVKQLLYWILVIWLTWSVENVQLLVAFAVYVGSLP